jgi:protein-tyrosine phosphatase
MVNKINNISFNSKNSITNSIENDSNNNLINNIIFIDKNLNNNIYNNISNQSDKNSNKKSNIVNLKNNQVYGKKINHIYNNKDNNNFTQNINKNIINIDNNTNDLKNSININNDHNIININNNGNNNKNNININNKNNIININNINIIHTNIITNNDAKNNITNNMSYNNKNEINKNNQQNNLSPFHNKQENNLSNFKTNCKTNNMSFYLSPIHKNNNSMNVNYSPNLNKSNNLYHTIIPSIRTDNINDNSIRNSNNLSSFRRTMSPNSNNSAKNSNNNFIINHSNIITPKRITFSSSKDESRVEDRYTPILNEVTRNIIELKEYTKEKRNKNLRNRGKSLLVGGPKKECSICHKLIETHLIKIHLNSHPSQIFRWLYLGTFSNACDINELRRIGINFILNCAAECHNTHLPEDIKEMHLIIRDEKKFNLISYFDKANVFLNNVRLQGGIILVHCKFGISRSVSFVIAYLIKYFGFNVKSALNFLKSKRVQSNPNEGFLTQLYNYEKLYKTKDK